MTTNEVTIERLKIIANDSMLGDSIREAACIAIDVLEKQNPKKPIRVLWEITCPHCKKAIGSYPYCAYCGQAIDWSEE
uniref:Ribosome, girodazole, girolline, antibiotic complex, 50S n=1 Tax=Myoviridae sp. ctj3P51 TaxID=2826687 RepID=A0A8S5NQ58_9CAUD|nr:MAG TPA: ribosome, girodazole, girolline, antibiotic complex, 50S [Myoviridae sp. ctj3P51]